MPGSFLGDRLRLRRKKKGFTQQELAKLIGAKHNSVSNWENSLNMPDASTIVLLCSVLSITPNDLLLADETNSDRDYTLSGDEAGLVNKYRIIADRDKGAILNMLDYYHSLVKVTAPMKEDKITANVISFDTVKGRISTQSAAAGVGTYLDDDNFSDITVISNPLTRKAAFYVPVSGDSMEPRFHDGDVLIIEGRQADIGEVGIFTLGNSGYVKVLGKGELISLNPDYVPIPINDDIICNGKVIGILEPEWIIE